MDSSGDDNGSEPTSPAARRLSYKFQRLRERIRAAIDAGELAGKLPGERSLARQFNVNAKTLSKALTDLAAEGLLERNIGLGTFVRDGTSAAPTAKILLLSDATYGSTLAQALSSRGLDVHSHVADGDLAPSLLAPFDLVLIASSAIGEEIVRDLIVRGKNVLSLDRLSKPYSSHALLPHHTLAATQAAKDLVTLGHRKLLLVPDDINDTDSHRAVTEAIPHAEVLPVSASDAAAAATDGFTGAVCASRNAPAVLAACRAAGMVVPDAFSVIAYGRLLESATCCGHYVSDEHIADAVQDLLSAGLPHRPLTLWLAGERTHAGTTAPPRSS
ncbi:MAG: ubiC [Phycisphaerales bacterium]|nr:ubiC [Phycisphaerales bacterium]